MFDEDFAKRLTELRMLKGVSARDMSLSIGQNPNYIFSIETGKMLPSMSAFFCICDYLKISPSEFFETKNKHPEEIKTLIDELLKHDAATIEALTEFIKRISQNQK